MSVSVKEVHGRVDIPPRTSLETVMVQMQRDQRPGRWDLRLKDGAGRLYSESLVGLNPVGHGYTYAVNDSVHRAPARSFGVNQWAESTAGGD